MTEAGEPSLASAADAFLAAMVAGDVGGLQKLLAATFVLTHMTGYQQPKQEWLEQIAAGQFRYYSIDEKARSIERTGALARVTSRTLTDARVYATRANWRLNLQTSFELQNQGWVVTGCLASTW